MWFNIPSCLVKAFKHLFNTEQMNELRIKKLEDNMQFMIERQKSIQSQLSKKMDDINRNINYTTDSRFKAMD